MYVLLIRDGACILEACCVSCQSDDAAVLEAFKRFEIVRSLDVDNPNVDVYCGDRKICSIGEVL